MKSSLEKQKIKRGGGIVHKMFFHYTRSSVSFLHAGLPSRIRAKNHILGYSLV